MVFVFIHGWACDRSFWRPEVVDLKRDFRCISVDLRGCGDSPPSPPYDLVTAADDIAGVIEALQLAPAIVVGHSLGGLVALLVNARRPELVSGVVLGDAPVAPGRPARWPRTVAAILEAGSMSPMAEVIESYFVDSTPDDVRDHVREVMLGCRAEVAAGMMANGDETNAQLTSLVKAADRKPFMAIWPEQPLGDPEWIRNETMFIRQEPISSAGHFFQLEQPAITNALLRAFVDDVRDDPRMAASVNAG